MTQPNVNTFLPHLWTLLPKSCRQISIGSGGCQTTKTTSPTVPRCLRPLFCFDWETATGWNYILFFCLTFIGNPEETVIAGDFGASVGQETGLRGIKKDDISGSAASILFIHLFFQSYCKSVGFWRLGFLWLLGFTLKVELDNRVLKSVRGSLNTERWLIISRIFKSRNSRFSTSSGFQLPHCVSWAAVLLPRFPAASLSVYCSGALQSTTQGRRDQRQGAF